MIFRTYCALFIVDLRWSWSILHPIPCRFTNARRRIVPRLKEELGYTRPSASSAPDLSASTSSSNETLTDTPGESSHSRSATSGSSRHVSVDSGATSLSSGRRFHGGEPALSMRRDSISAPDLSSSGCSQLKAALLERTPSGHVIAEKQPKISGEDPCFNSVKRPYSNWYLFLFGNGLVSYRKCSGQWPIRTDYTPPTLFFETCKLHRIPRHDTLSQCQWPAPFSFPHLHMGSHVVPTCKL